jgi:hypothetical protein
MSSSVGRLLLASVAGFAAGLVLSVAFVAIVLMLPGTAAYAGPVIVGGCLVFFGSAAATAAIVMDGGRPRLVDDARPPDVEPLDDAALAAIRTAREPAPRSAWPMFLVVFFVLVYAFARGNTAATIVVALLCVLLHEVCQWSSMRAFGYNDPRLYLIPLFGRLRPGKRAASASEECVTLLVGPLVGLMLAIGLLAVIHPTRGSVVLTAAGVLIGFNGLELMPFTGFDGGRLLNRLIFARHPVLETLGTGAMASGAALLGYHFKWYPILALGLVWLFLVQVAYWMASSAATLRRRWPRVSADLATAPDDYLRDLYASTVRLRRRRQPTAAALAGWMRAVHGRVIEGSPSTGATIAFLMAYGGVWLLGLVALVMRVKMGR